MPRKTPITSGVEAKIYGTDTVTGNPTPVDVTDGKLGVDTEIELSSDSVNVTNNLDLKAYKTAISYDGNGEVEYVGEAEAGTADGDNVWRIKKLIYSSGDVIDVQWADGVDTFTKSWTGREGYTYS